MFTFDEPTVTYQAVVSDGVRNTYAAGVQSGKVFVQKLDELGAEVWSTVLPNTEAARVFKIILDANQDIYIAATEGAINRKALTLSLRRTDGGIRWTNSIPCEGITQFVDIASGKSGNSILLYHAAHVGVGSNTDILVRRINPASGVDVWQRTLAGGQGKTDFPARLVSSSTGTPFMAYTEDEKMPTVVRLSGTDGSTVWIHQQAILDIVGNARDLSILSDGRLGFTFDGKNAAGQARVGIQFLEASNGFVAGSRTANTSAGGKIFIEGNAPTKRATIMASFALGNNDFALREVARDGTLTNIAIVKNTNKNLELDACGQLFFTQTAVPKIFRLPNAAEVDIPTQAFDVDIDNKDQITIVLSKKIIKLRQRSEAIGDTFNLPIASGKISASAPGVLRNDAGLTGATVQLVETTTKGTLLFNSNGSFEYTPGGTFNGTDTFKYRLVKDGISSVATVTLNELRLNDHFLSASIFGGDSVNGALVFNLSPDPSLVLEVTDTSSLVTSPAPKPFGLGFGTSRTYTLSTVPVTANVDVTITARVSSISSTRILQLRPGGLKDLAAFKTLLISGEGTVGAIFLTGPRSGTAFLSASNSVMSVPATVAVSGTSTGFLITTSQSFVSQAVTLSCTLGVTTKTLAFQVAAMPKVASLQGFPNVIGGASLSIGINLDKVTPYSLPCATSRAPDSPFLTVPSEVVIPSGINFRTFNAITTQVGATKNFTVSVTVGGATQTKNVTVLINPLDSVTLTPSTVVGGNTSQGTVHFNNLAPPEGVQVTLQKTATDIDIPQTVRVPGGAWKVDFQVLTKPVSSNGTRTIFAKVGTITKSAVLTVIR